MVELFKKIDKKVNGVIWSLFSTGIIMIMLSILIVWTNFVLRLVIGMFVLVVAYIFLYGAYKVWSLKKEIKKHFRF